MRIFPRRYALAIYRAQTPNQLFKILDRWADEVIYPGSPLLRQIASYYLRKHGGSYSPRLLKQVLGDEILRVMGKEDLKASILLGLLIAYRRFQPEKGRGTLINWLSWMGPYEAKKYIYWREIHPIEPSFEEFFPSEYNFLELLDRKKRKIDILSEDLGLNRQQKQYYYLKSLEEKDDARKF